MTDWFTADELAHLFRWTPAYVRRLASEQQWRRTGRAPTRFLIDDAMAHRARVEHARQES